MKRSGSFVIIAAFLTAIIIGTLLLRLPAATVNGSLKFEDAFFTSASAVTVTGLIVVDTATYFTFFGQLIILLLLQFGGLGFMTFSTLFILLLGKSVSLKDTFIIENDFTGGAHKNIKHLIKKIFLMTFIIELIGAILLYFNFSNLETGKRIFSAIFHSVSAFCNAGFSIFSNSFENYLSDTGVNIILVILIILGGIGFLVLDEILLFFKRRIKTFSKFSLHSKLVIISSSVLIVGGFLVILIEELLNSGNNLSLGANVLSAFFQSVTARTAGFNTINLNYLSFASIFIIILLMIIGASPGSTGGGIKTTPISILFAYFRSRMRGREKVDLFYRNIRAKTVEKAFIVIILSFLLISFSFLLLLTFESNFKMNDLIFETVSAFGTVGLSMGITAQLSLPSKIILVITMFIGRIGLLTLMIAISKRESKAVYDYPEANIMIG
jgi:trk system potassium uptake protein TrkH